MKKTLFLALISVFIASQGFALTWDNGGGGSSGTGVVAYTVATLPGAPSDGDFAIVTDGADASDCTVGAGTALNACIYDTGGAAWVITGDGAGSGNSFSTHDTPAGTDPVASGADTLTWDDTAPIVITGNSGTDTITVSITDATTAAKGAAQFHADNFSVAAGVVTIKAAGVAKAEVADADYGDFTIATNAATLDADVVAAAEMADADHGMVSWTGGAATVEDFALNAAADAGDADILSVDKLEGVDNAIYIDMGADTLMEIVADARVDITSAAVRLEVDAAAYLNIATADGGATTISQVSDGTDTINIGDGGDRVDIASDTWDVTNGVISASAGINITAADGQLADFSGITHTGAVDEGLVLPTWANVAPGGNAGKIAWDTTAGAVKVYDGGWVTFATVAAPLDAKYIVQQADATLTAEQSLGALGASGILYSTNVTGIVSLATEAQLETLMGLGFGASKAATSGYIFVADGTDFESVAMSGDVTIATGGATTIGADTVALTTDTTGNYTASIADAGNTTITVVNGATEAGAVTLDAVDLNCTDCINATEIEDIYPLMAGDTVAGNMIWNGTMTLNGAVTLGAIMTVEATADEIQATAGQDIVFQLGDNAGANVIEFEDSDGVAVFYVNSDGAVTYVSTNNPYFMFNEDDASPKFAMRHFDTTTDVWQVGTTTSDPNTQFTKVSEVDASGNFNVIGSYEIDGTQIALTDLSDGLSHGSGHILSGADEVDGDLIDVDYAETNYTPATTGVATNINHLAAHLEGIDDALGASAAGTFANLTDTAIAAPAAGHIAIYDGVNSWDNKAIQSPFALDSSGNLTIAAHLTVGDYNLTNVGDVALDSISADATNISIVASGGTVTVESVVFTGGALTGITTATASVGFALGDGDYIGIPGNEIMTFNAAGSIAVTGATMDVDGAFTASTIAADTTVAGTTITASTGFALGDTDYIGITSNEIITFNTAGTIAVSGAELTFGGGNGILFTDDNYLELDATPDGMDDNEYSGIVIGGRSCGESLTQWDLVEIVNDADPWHKADATAASGEYPAFGIAVAACTDTNEARILVRGIVRNEAWTGLTPGAPIYLGETDGALTETAPSTSNDAVQIVGWALSDSEIYFDFSRPYQLVE